MKKQFFDLLISIMAKNKDIYFVSCGLGWPRTDEIKEKFFDQYIQTEASEQTALDIAAGLAMDGKIPFVYTITPFFYRAFETIRTFINHERLNVKLIGAGRDDDYSKDDGYTHDANDIYSLFNGNKGFFNYFLTFYPDTINELKEDLDEILKSKYPCFLSIPR